MTEISTIALLNAARNGQEVKIGGPAAPKPTKVPKIVAPDRVPMTAEQLAEREKVRSRLQVGVWIIEFKKVDGSPSIMEATLDARLLPPADLTESPVARLEQDHLLRVYAVDRQGWRSFTVNNLTRMYKASESL